MIASKHFLQCLLSSFTLPVLSINEMNTMKILLILMTNHIETAKDRKGFNVFVYGTSDQAVKSSVV